MGLVEAKLWTQTMVVEACAPMPTQSRSVRSFAPYNYEVNELWGRLDYEYGRVHSRWYATGTLQK